MATDYLTCCLSCLQTDKRMARVAVVTSSYPSPAHDAAGHFVQTEVRQLRAAGHHVSVLTPETSPDGSSTERDVYRLPAGDLFGWPGAISRLKQRPWRAVHLIRLARHIRRQLRALQCEQLITHWLLPCAWPLVCSDLGSTKPKDDHLSGVKLTVVVHGSDGRLLLRLPPGLGRAILAPLHARGAEFRFVSEDLRRQFRQRFGALVEPNFCQPCPVEITAVPTKVRARRLLGLEADEFYALNVGRLVSSKRVHVALERAPVPKGTVWTVIGDGPARKSLCRRFPQARFTGQLSREQTLLWLRAADVLVSASLAEGAPSVIREARLLGTEVWSAAVADVPKWARTDPGIRLLEELG